MIAVVGHDVLRPASGRDQRDFVAHLFPESNHWWPIREAVCGREFPTERLVPQPDGRPVCVKCKKGVHE